MLVVVIDGGEGAEEEAADVSKNGGAAGRDASFGEEIVESAEGVVDALRPLEIESVAGEHFAEVNGPFCRSVVRAESGGRVAGEGAALPSGGGAMLTTGGAGDWVGGLSVHGFVLFWRLEVRSGGLKLEA